MENLDSAPTKDLMTPSSRHPFQTFIMFLCLSSGIPILFGKAAAPQSLEASLSPAALYAWGLTLVFGAIFSLIGAAFRNRLKGLLLEQIGLVSVGVAAILYAGIAIATRGLDSGILLSVSIVGAFGAACLWRFWQIQRFLRSIAKVVAKNREGEKGR